jgi:hypothetical protein
VSTETYCRFTINRLKKVGFFVLCFASKQLLTWQ